MSDFKLGELDSILGIEKRELNLLALRVLDEALLD
jgi:hypothetical protein